MIKAPAGPGSEARVPTLNTNLTGAMSAPNTSAGADIIGLTDAQRGQLFECSDHGTSTPARRPSLDDNAEALARVILAVLAGHKGGEVL